MALVASDRPCLEVTPELLVPAFTHRPPAVRATRAGHHRLTEAEADHPPSPCAASRAVCEISGAERASSSSPVPTGRWTAKQSSVSHATLLWAFDSAPHWREAADAVAPLRHECWWCRSCSPTRGSMPAR